MDNSALDNSVLAVSDPGDVAEEGFCWTLRCTLLDQCSERANTGSSQNTAMSVTGPLTASMYRIVLTVSFTDYMSSTAVIMTRDFIYVETVTIYSSFQATFYF